MSLQRDIAGQITNTLRLTISGEAHNRMMKHYTDNPEAYQLYLKGRYYLNKGTVDAWKKAVGYFNQAIDKDPTYAWLILGWLLIIENSNGILAPNEAQPKAEAFAKKALALDETLAKLISSSERLEIITTGTGLRRSESSGEPSS